MAVNGKLAARINKGEFHERIIDGPALILSSRPILVAQYANGTEFDHYGNGLGDPFMMQVPPIEQSGGEYLLTTPVDIRNYWDAPDYTNYLNLIVFADGAGTISLDGVKVAAGQFQSIGNGAYAGAQVPISPGAHRLSAAVPFNVCVYGWASYESYAFMGGIYTDSVEADTRVELTQPTPYAAVGSRKTAFARATNGRALPLANLHMTFTVSGVNPITSAVQSSRLGEATFVYTGTNAGVDFISVQVGELTQSVTNRWIATAENTPPSVATAGTLPLQFGFTAQLDGAVTDDGRPTGADLRVRWRLLDGPGAAQFDDGTSTVTRAVCSVPGAYRFDLTADDSEFSSSEQVTVTLDLAPEVRFPVLAIPPVVVVGSNTPLVANAADFDGSVDHIEFYANDSLVGTVTAANPWSDCSADWIPLTNGSFQLRAVAIDNLGASVTSDTVTVQATFPPQLDVTLPDHELTLPYGASTVALKARAWDPDGTVTNLAAFLVADPGPMLVCQTAGGQLDFTGPIDVGGGYYQKYGYPHRLRFVATEDQGISTELDSFTITLLPPTMTVNWVSPVQDQAFRVGQTVNLAAEASVTPPALIDRLVYFVSEGTSGYWSYANQPATAPPFTNLWIPSAPGDYLVKAIACADTETCEWTSIRAIRVLPAIGVSIATPTNSAHLLLGCPSQISLALDDPTCVFDHAEFFANGISLGQTTNMTMTWLPSQTGDYTLNARVYDRQDRVYDPEQPVSVRVSPPPTIAISLRTIPANRTNVLVGFPILLVAQFSATNPVPIAKVEFFADGDSLGEVTHSPFVLPYISTNTGLHILTARVTTVYGTVAESSPIEVQCGLRLRLSWEGVRAGEWVPVGTNLSLGVRLDDPGSIFHHLEFLANGTVLGSTERCFLDWTPPAAGDYALRARAYDRFGNTYLSEDITIHSAVLRQPEVRFITPASMARFASGQPVSFSVQATSPDSPVTNLSLFRFGQAQCSVAGDTLNYTWTNLPAGELRFRAIATDDKGLTGQAKVRIVVDARPDAGLAPPQNLTAQVLGCNAIEISWSTNSGNATDRVVIERAEGTNEVWEVVDKVPPSRGTVTDYFLHAATVYRYRAYLLNAAGSRSVDSSIVVTRTQAYVPGHAILDLAENLQNAGAFDVAAADDKRQALAGLNPGPDQLVALPELGRAELLLGLAAQQRRPTASMVPMHARKRKGALQEPERRSPTRRQVDCGDSQCARSETGAPIAWFMAVMPTPEFRCLYASYTPESDAPANTINLDAFGALGISDLNSVLLYGGLTNYLWWPGGTYLPLTDTNFFPFGLARSGMPVGTRVAEIQIAPLNIVTQLHAVYWNGSFVDLTPDPQTLRYPQHAAARADSLPDL